jgi:hypothetical protein
MVTRRPLIEAPGSTRLWEVHVHAWRVRSLPCPVHALRLPEYPSGHTRDPQNLLA